MIVNILTIKLDVQKPNYRHLEIRGKFIYGLGFDSVSAPESLGLVSVSRHSGCGQVLVLISAVLTTTLVTRPEKSNVAECGALSN